jgi:hypothetical protein
MRKDGDGFDAQLSMAITEYNRYIFPFVTISLLPFFWPRPLPHFHYVASVT